VNVVSKPSVHEPLLENDQKSLAALPAIQETIPSKSPYRYPKTVLNENVPETMFPANTPMKTHKTLVLSDNNSVNRTPTLSAKKKREKSAISEDDLKEFNEKLNQLFDAGGQDKIEYLEALKILPENEERCKFTLNALHEQNRIYIQESNNCIWKV
jgi:hypothetical protein